jgi:hypothetical protein
MNPQPRTTPQVLGRQPAFIRITPSGTPSPWNGAIVDGQRFTEQQQAELIRRGMDVPTAKAMTVRRKVGIEDAVWPTFDPWPIYEFECPVLNELVGGFVNVISPSGKVKVVQADGWIAKPKKRRGGGW